MVERETLKIIKYWASGQDGGVGRHTVPPYKPKEGQQQFKNKKQLELTENRIARKSDNQGDKEETFIQTGRRGGDGQQGQGGLTVGGLAAGEPSEMVDCGTGQAMRQLADPTRWWLADSVAPHAHIDKPGGMAGEQNRPRNPGLQHREIKPQTSD